MNALFSRKQKEKKSETPKASAPVVSGRVSVSDLSHVLMQPRITEKATIVSSMSVYVFNIASRATKREVSQAVEKTYKVRPRKVRIVNIPEKNVRNSRTGARGTKQGGKKAYVYLNKGETITLA